MSLESISQKNTYQNLYFEPNSTNSESVTKPNVCISKSQQLPQRLFIYDHSKASALLFQGKIIMEKKSFPFKYWPCITVNFS